MRWNQIFCSSAVQLPSCYLDKGKETMLFRLFLIFSVVPIIEIWLLIKVGRVIGALPTVCLLLVISLVGAWLASVVRRLLQPTAIWMP
jgi:uncharacterized membrane protein YqjE